jgi:sigma-E factor negative regulatory protein RseB
LALCGFGGLAVAAETAEAMIQRMMTASRTLDYEGVFVYQRGADLDTMRVIHRGSGQTEMERLVSLTGPAREVIRDGTKVTCKFADKRSVMVEARQPRSYRTFGITGPVDSMGAIYRIEADGQDRVAGRNALSLRVTPHTPDRYAYRLWMDEESGLLLKSVILDEHDRPLEQEQFAEVSIGLPLPDERFESELNGTDVEWFAHEAGPEVVQQAAEVTPWQVNWLPKGFLMRQDKTQNLSTSKLPVRHFVYSDGLATVSIFIEKLRDEAAPLRGYTLVGAVNAYSLVAHQHQVTVVGEIPQVTVRRIAGSVAPRATE